MWTPGTPITFDATGKSILTTTVGAVKGLRIYQFPTNTHTIFSGDSTLDPTATPPTGISGWAGAPGPTGPAPLIDAYETNSMNGIDANKIFVYGTPGEIVLWSYVIQ
jgi:hypothetical protein